MILNSTRQVVVVGNGMVGHRFIERLIEFDLTRHFRIATFCEEPRAAYDRVGLTSFFAHRDAEKLMIARLDWYREHGIEIHLGDRAAEIDRRRRIVRSDRGVEVAYDLVVLATGSYPFVPPVPGIQKRGVFVYRTIEDLQKIIEWGKTSRRCAVIGGGLLGLEAAKAAHDLGLETHVIEFNPRLMPRQIDDAGSRVLVERIEKLGVRVHLNRSTKEVGGESDVERIVFQDGGSLDVEMIIVSAGIRPRDELARECGLTVGERGGVAVDDQLRTSDPQIFAIGEVALHRGAIYGLVAPGYEMAEIVAANLTGADRHFQSSDLSTKLKLMGVEVASFGQYDPPSPGARPLVIDDPIGGIYKKLLVSGDGQRLLGGILVGDAGDYATLAALAKSDRPLTCSASELLMGPRGAKTAGGAEALPDEAQVCSCNNVRKAGLCQAIRDGNLSTLADVKLATRAGTGCGGCLPLVGDLLQCELKAAGKGVNQSLCEHFAHSRQELFEIAKIRGLRTFGELIAAHGCGQGCEICKPAVASILASLHNEPVLGADHQTLQDTNDRFLANIQRGGLYSVVPRVPGGEITPDKLIVLGRVAKKYGLYTKITGGQRIDLFGAQVHQLPDIWEELIAAGFESGHAYGKAVRTVKSCVGSTWCRYGVQDSVGFAIRVEERYRGIRAPHKLKFAVSGCVRECAEAQCKDVGLIATETGYNLYVCGNGGAKPRHADLFATDLSEAEALKIIDRFLMYYIETADRLTRTSVWLEKMPGGLAQLQDVVLRDKLGICEELEARMERLVASYQCEWREVVENPERRRQFRQYVNCDETDLGIEIIDERGQKRPADWPKGSLPIVERPQPAPRPATGDDAAGPRWVRVGQLDDFPVDGGATVKYGRVEIAVFNFASRGEWYACQNMCPHRNAFVLSRGILGDAAGTPKVACPLHKKTFALASGECLTGEPLSVKVFPVRIEGDEIYLQLPPSEQLDALLATEHHAIRADCAGCHASPALACFQSAGTR